MDMPILTMFVRTATLTLNSSDHTPFIARIQQLATSRQQETKSFVLPRSLLFDAERSGKPLSCSIN